MDRFRPEINELRKIRDVVVENPDQMTDDDLKKSLETMRLVLAAARGFRIRYEKANNPYVYDRQDFSPGDPRHD